MGSFLKSFRKDVVSACSMPWPPSRSTLILPQPVLGSLLPAESCALGFHKPQVRYGLCLLSIRVRRHFTLAMLIVR